jgi:hypothetical protein
MSTPNGTGNIYTHVPVLLTFAHFSRYFNRDVECIRRFFRRRFNYESALYPRFSKTVTNNEDDEQGFRLDVVVAASGFGGKEMKTLDEVGYGDLWLKTRYQAHDLILVHGVQTSGR